VIGSKTALSSRRRLWLVQKLLSLKPSRPIQKLFYLPQIKAHSTQALNCNHHQLDFPPLQTASASPPSQALSQNNFTIVLARFSWRMRAANWNRSSTFHSSGYTYAFNVPNFPMHRGILQSQFSFVGEFLQPRNFNDGSLMAKIFTRSYDWHFLVPKSPTLRAKNREAKV
jgi:hypothetical protein